MCKLADNSLNQSLFISNLLQDFMPLPPPDVETEADLAEPKLQFSYVECVMYTFHQLGRKYPDFLTSEISTERLKDFRLRFGS